MLTVLELFGWFLRFLRSLPPSFLQWVRADWIRSGALIGCLLLVGLYVEFRFYRVERVASEFHRIVVDCTNELRSLKRQVVTYEGCRTGSPDGDPPIRVTFADGIVAYVNYFQQVKPLDPQVCPVGSIYIPGNGIIWEPVKSQEPLPTDDCKAFRLPQGPAAEFFNMTLATVISELERLSLVEARKDREGISERIREQVSKKFVDHGVKLDVLHL